MALQGLKTTADLEAAANPVVSVTYNGLTLDEVKALFRLLWFSYLAQWGPRVGKPGRKQHHWRLHMLLNFLHEVEGPLEDTPEWDAFLDNLAGFASYSGCTCSYDAHHKG